MIIRKVERLDSLSLGESEGEGPEGRGRRTT
jgi:hypothetical protein